MIQQFWRTMIGLVLFVLIFSTLSWAYLFSQGIGFTAPATKLQLLSLPTGIPSLWNVSFPATDQVWFAPFFVLILQVFLTGGFYGTLVRVNTGQSHSMQTFLVDASRSFWRLFLWNLLWTAVNVLLVGVVRVFPQSNATFTVVVLLCRYACLFVEVGLVCERRISVAIKSATSGLLQGFIAMLPYGVVIIVGTGFVLSISATIGATALLGVTLLYGAVMTWVQHMVVARYMYFSRWGVRAGLQVETEA